MTPNSRPYSIKFGPLSANAICLRPSLIGLWLIRGLYLGANIIVWQLNWPYWLCITANIVMVWLMINTVNRYLFAMTHYHLSFFFGDAQGWVVQEGEYICYRALLRYAFCGRYLVILIFQNKLIMPIFFDSLPATEFRQLRKILILLDYA